MDRWTRWNQYTPFNSIERVYDKVKIVAMSGKLSFEQMMTKISDII